MSAAGAALGLVAVDIAAAGADRLFTYAVPPELAAQLRPGQWVEVPFGARRQTGLYIGPAAAAPDGVRIRPIARLLPEIPALPPDLVELAGWVQEQTLCRFVQALRLLLPAPVRRQQVRARQVAGVSLTIEPDAARALAGALQDRAPLQARLVQALLAAGDRPVAVADLVRELGQGVRGALQSLGQKGTIVRLNREERRDPLLGADWPALAGAAAAPRLTPEQTAAVTAIRAAGTAGRPALLWGVTGSGKTEVYLQAIAATVAAGRQALVLVPEIALTPQIIARFRGRFGDRVAVLHSGLGSGERFDEWRRIRTGQADIAIGARSAVFAPLARPGLIVLDEEHETTYKQEEAPRYHARDVALERARQRGAGVVLGSATPSLESYLAASQGRYELIRLSQRVDGRALPRVQVVDMRRELRQMNRSMFSRPLAAALNRCLAAGRQAILLLNRRGFASFLLCRDCGEAVMCPSCSVTLTLHAGERRLRCHYCDHTAPVPTCCPGCGGGRIRPFGAGTERVEAELKERFAGVGVLRLDVDTVRRKGSHTAILTAFARTEAQVLVGTQMVAKGLDFPGVSLVGVVAADTALFLPDFRAAERTFALLTQVAGRAGRGEAGGEVIVQTYNPEHYSVQSAARHDFAAFAAEELPRRRALGYPPYAGLARLVLSGPVEQEVAAAAERLGRQLAALDECIAVLGPAPAPLQRLRGRHRWQIMLKAEGGVDLAAALRPALAAAADPRAANQVRLSVDIAPVSML